MRLLYVIHQFFPDCHSGTEQHCLAAAREAERRGHDVTVLSLHWDHDRTHPPVNVFEAPYEGLRVIRLNHWRGVNPNDVLRDYENLHLDGWFQRVLDDVQPDAVHSFHLRQLGGNLLRVARESGRRVVVTLTDFWFLCPRFTLMRPDGSLCDGPPDGGRGCVTCEFPELEHVEPGAHTLGSDPPARLRALLDRSRALLRDLGHAHVVTAPSRFLAEMFRRNGLEHDRFETVPYGLEPDRIQPLPTTRPRAPLRIGFCGVLSPWKGVHVLLDAVLGSDAAVELTIHGRTDQPTFQAYIDEQMDRAASDPRVRFAGAYDEADAPRVFAEMDLLVAPSLWYENTPFVMLEAFAAGVPVIASDLGGLREVVQPDRNGVVFPAGDAAALRAAIERVAGDPSWFEQLDVQPMDDISACFDRYEAAYSEHPPTP
jgi:glycosyltransferase involved in cell wall biosynthesis